MEDENYIPVESDEEEEINLPFTEITFDDCFDDYGEPKDLNVWGARKMHYIESPDVFDITKFEQAFELEELIVTQTDIDIDDLIEKLEKLPKIKHISVNLKPHYCWDLQFIPLFLQFLDKTPLKQVYITIKVHHTVKHLVE